MPNRYMRAQVTLPYDSQIPRDASSNSWHVEITDLGTEFIDAFADVINAVVAVYTDVDQYFSSELTSPGRIRLYDLEDAPPRLPVWDTDFIVQPAPDGSVDLPNEVALCLSFRGAITSGVNRKRNRGRIYFGPLTGGNVTGGVGDVYSTSTLARAIANAASTHLDPIPMSLSGGSAVWSVFSRSNALGLAVGAPQPAQEPTYTAAQLAAGFTPVASFYVDDAWDTQRRRGKQAVNRYVATV